MCDPETGIRPEPDSSAFQRIVNVRLEMNLFRFVLVYMFLVFAVRAEDFNIDVGATVSDGVPAPGAGRLSSAQESDFYMFTASAGQLIFAEPLAQDAAFQQNLRWQLLRPNGVPVFSAFFTSIPGRSVLPDAGVYKIRVFTDGTNPSRIGTYSFRILAIPPDQTFAYSIGTVVTNGVPAAGAGELEAAGAEDRYTFNGTAGDLVFFESLNQAAAFKQNLRWQLNRPNGTPVFSSFFTNPEGRILLPDTGEYTLRIFTSGNDATWLGNYSFRTQPIPPDQTFAYTIGTVVTNGVPAVGAGNLEVPGAEDNYTFNGTAGQIVFFESLNQNASYANNLRWQLLAPDGKTVFSSFFTNPQGRTVLPVTGQYKLRIFTGGTDPRWFGPYSFRTQGIAQDQTFPYTIGTVVSDGIPAAGAGKLEDPGSEDNYTFIGTAGQIVFFESLRQAAAFQNNLRWQLLAPDGTMVFSSFFANPQGRTVLPVAGEYRLRIFTGGDDPGWFGDYSFSTQAIGDQEIPIMIGNTVSDGQPASGAGRIETPGSEDVYTFAARAGEVIVVESIAQAAAFQNNLRWQILRPSGQMLFSSFFNNSPGRIVLPDEGTYKIRVAAEGDNPAWVGDYSFRTYARVFAGQDNTSTKPDRPVSIPIAKLLFNDLPENSFDTLALTLPGSTTGEGGSVSVVGDAVLYTPKAGFTGYDRFTYRLLGGFGGTNETSVRVAVTPLADDFATMVNWAWRANQMVEACFMGQKGTTYQLESSTDLGTWVPVRTIAESESNVMTFTFSVSGGPRQTYFRARATGSGAIQP
jgi:hypothetical protein